MNPAETVILVGYVRALCPQQKFDEYTPDAWHDVLGGYTFAEARAAAGAHVRAGHAFVAVGEIAAEIRKARNGRLDRHAESEPPVGDRGDDETYKAALLSERTAIAEGREEPRARLALPPGAPAPEPSNLASVAIEALAEARGVPSARAGVVNVLAVPCPHCLAPAKRTCRAFGKSMSDAHPARLEDARRIAAGRPPVDQSEVKAEEWQRREAARLALAASGPSTFVPPTQAEIDAEEKAAKRRTGAAS